ncbi:MAG: DinB family protein [Actinomycetota bacterium]|nr:DinB family protein [Actinomycetota bacterium]
MSTPSRLVPLLAQYDWACERLVNRLEGPAGDSGDGEHIEIPAITDDEYRWEPVRNSWTVRPRADGPGPGATVLAGTGEWGRDGGRPHPWPPPITTIAWRAALVAADDAALDTVGWSSYPNGSDPEDPFLDTVWWVNQEVLHHGAEIALLRDLYGAGQL